jgi:5,6-dimethylbenzimidazole synthase
VTEQNRNAPEFNESFRAKLDELFVWRRDVRHFLPDEIPDEIMAELLDAATLAPSVGYSQPWRFVAVENESRREKIRQIFEKSNSDALSDYRGEKAGLYASLKLEGLNQAPVHLAVFVDTTTATGSGLGRKTMPETLHYSTVLAVHTLWLAARARGIGVGWVSIIDPVEVQQVLDVSDDWELIGYLCVGYPKHEDSIPELERKGWQDRDDAARILHRR